MESFRNKGDLSSMGGGVASDSIRFENIGQGEEILFYIDLAARKISFPPWTWSAFRLRPLLLRTDESMNKLKKGRMDAEERQAGIMGGNCTKSAFPSEVGRLLLYKLSCAAPRLTSFLSAKHCYHFSELMPLSALLSSCTIAMSFSQQLSWKQIETGEWGEEEESGEEKAQRFRKSDAMINVFKVPLDSCVRRSSMWLMV